MSWLARFKPYRFTGESRPCVLCGSRERTPVGTRDRYWMPLRNVLCAGCGLVFLDPMPTADEIERYYRDEYRQHYHGDSKPRAKALLRDERGARERVALESSCCCSSATPPAEASGAEVRPVAAFEARYALFRSIVTT